MAVKAINLLQKAGAILANQMPMIRGVNDESEVVADLMSRLSFVGVVPYYIFQCRPALGNRSYTVPIEQAYETIEQAKARLSGLAKRVHFVMSHSTGKIEIIGKTQDCIYFKYREAVENADNGRILIFKSNPTANWIDDYPEMITRPPTACSSDCIASNDGSKI